MKKFSFAGVKYYKTPTDRLFSLYLFIMSAFRFSAKRAFLTYSDVCEYFTKETVYYDINERYPLKFYFIAEERHISGGRHIHCVFEFRYKVDSRDPSFLDINDGNCQHHPNVQIIKKGQAHWDRCIEYSMKEDPLPFANIELKPTWGELFDKAQDAEHYLQLVKTHYPRDYALNYTRLVTMARANYPILNVNTVYDFSLTWEISLPQELLSFEPLPMKSVVVVGPAGCGKTTWAKLVAPKPCLFVRHLDSLAELLPNHQSIIFDDLEFGHLPNATQKFLVDMENLAEIHIRYRVAKIPSGTMRIFTGNTDPFSVEYRHREAIDRRCTYINLK